MILFDTTFLIDLANADQVAAKLASDMDGKGEVAALSVVSMHEYLLGVYLANYGKSSLEGKLESAERDLSKFRILPLTADIARISSKVQAQVTRSGKPIGLNDIYISATAMRHDIELVSRNTKHFGAVSGLRFRGY